MQIISEWKVFQPLVLNIMQKNNISVLAVYKQLFDNTTIKFDLTNDGNKIVCRHNKDYTVSNVSYFTRKCQYIRDEHDKIYINWIYFFWLYITMDDKTTTI